MKKSFYTVIWIVLIALASLSCLWFTGRFGANLYHFFRCSSRVDGKIIEWKVVEPKKGEYLLSACYSYRADGVNYLGNQIFKTPLFNNPHSAEYVLKNYVNKKWPVWIDKKNPNISTLQRQFSIKLLVQALMSIGVLIYFLWLKEYMTVHNTTDLANPRRDLDSNEKQVLQSADGDVSSS